ncbi:hypothetical protein EVAR_61908_1 [Eumeta japonica]|uniref:Uncharacterized protein n=1 Tax=Eumeta variegata TaxID=151549 RepID=A0A4C1YJD3_EUMVA|nr:hypothetical protein EVAR_61908_1 [Eumeta japonica]
MVKLWTDLQSAVFPIIYKSSRKEPILASDFYGCKCPWAAVITYSLMARVLCQFAQRSEVGHGHRADPAARAQCVTAARSTTPARAGRALYQTMEMKSVIYL